MKRIVPFISILLFLSARVYTQSCNQLKDPYFKKYKERWTFYSQSGGLGRYEKAPEGGARIAIIYKGSQFWSLQLVQGGLSVQKGKKYILEFTAKADSLKDIEANFGLGKDDYKKQFVKKIRLDATLTQYAIEFVADTTGGDMRVEFNIGKSLTPVTFTHVNFQEAACTNDLTWVDPADAEIAKATDSKTHVATKIEQKLPQFANVSIDGYFRSHTTFRQLNTFYQEGSLTPQTFFQSGVTSDDDPNNGYQTGYKEPLLMLNFIVAPVANVELNMDILIDNQFTGLLWNPNPDNTGFSDNEEKHKRIQNYRYVNFGSKINTDYGNFDIKAGGALFESMTQLTMYRYEFRDDMFERYPWEWYGSSWNRYERFYNDKNIARDSRWGNQTVQGVVLKGDALPFRIGAKTILGKTSSINGSNTFTNGNFQYLWSSQLSKTVGKQYVSLNSYYQKSYADNNVISGTPANEQSTLSFTAETKFKFDLLSINAEFGALRYRAIGSVTDNWGPAVIANINFAQKLTKLPVVMKFFYIDKDFFNNNNSVLNASNTHLNTLSDEIERQQQLADGEEDTKSQYNNNLYEGGIGEMGQLITNRTNVSVSTGKNIKNINIGLALAMGVENEKLFDIVTFQHRLNGVNRSALLYYRNQAGPYDRNLNQWRQSFEKIAVDSNETANKGYNTIDFSLKYKTKFLGKELILTNFMNWNSIGSGFSPIPRLSDKAYLNQLFQEFMVFYKFHPKCSFVTLFGTEFAKGGSKTAMLDKEHPTKILKYNAAGKAINQSGKGIGFGLDWDVSEKTGLFFRQRFYSYTDKNFVLSRLSGFESNVELKVFF